MDLHSLGSMRDITEYNNVSWRCRLVTTITAYIAVRVTPNQVEADGAFYCSFSLEQN